MTPRSRNNQYCYTCHATTWHIRGVEFNDWVCDSRECQERRLKALRIAQQGIPDGNQGHPAPISEASNEPKR